jgi:amino acid permease
LNFKLYGEVEYRLSTSGVAVIVKVVVPVLVTQFTAPPAASVIE